MKKVLYLEGLRGVAAFLVVISHLCNTFYPALYWGNPAQAHLPHNLELIIANSPLGVINAGDLAVCIFFILSGYVLTIKFFLTGDNNIIKRGFLKRYLRLLLPILFTILLTCLIMKLHLFYNLQVAPISLSTNWLSNYWTFHPSFLDALNESFVGLYFYMHSTYNNAYWTITYEFMGSFLVMFAAFILYDVKLRGIIYLILGVFFSIHITYLLFLVLSWLI